MSITVKELIVALADFDEDDIIILAKDREGNDFSPLDQLTCDNYTPENTWSGNIHLRSLTPEDMPCITLWPIN